MAILDCVFLAKDRIIERHECSLTIPIYLILCLIILFHGDTLGQSLAPTLRFFGYTAMQINNIICYGLLKALATPLGTNICVYRIMKNQ
jgi:hypothetical protein